MECSKCRSNDIIKASVAYEMGSSSGGTRSVGIGEIDGAVGLSTGLSRGRFRTDFAKRFRPPDRFPYEMPGSVIAGAAIAALLLWLFDPQNGSFGAYLILGVAILVGYGMYRSVASDERAKRRTAIAKYQNLWVCLRCGEADEYEAFMISS